MGGRGGSGATVGGWGGDVRTGAGGGTEENSHTDWEEDNPSDTDEDIARWELARRVVAVTALAAAAAVVEYVSPGYLEMPSNGLDELDDAGSETDSRLSGPRAGSPTGPEHQQTSSVSRNNRNESATSCKKRKHSALDTAECSSSDVSTFGVGVSNKKARITEAAAPNTITEAVGGFTDAIKTCCSQTAAPPIASQFICSGWSLDLSTDPNHSALHTARSSSSEVWSTSGAEVPNAKAITEAAALNGIKEALEDLAYILRTDRSFANGASIHPLSVVAWPAHRSGSAQ